MGMARKQENQVAQSQEAHPTHPTAVVDPVVDTDHPKTGDPAPPPAPPAPRRDDGTGLVELDPWLEPYSDRLRGRYAHYLWRLDQINQTGGLLGPVSQGHHYFGLNRGERDGQPGVWYREWAPAAQGLFLSG